MYLIWIRAQYKMLKFEKKQGILDISGVKIGGQPGELPTVLIGSIFYEGHKIVEDSIRGKFDKKEAEILLNKQTEMSDKTGNPVIVDIVGSTEQALIRYIDFVAENTEVPFLVDGPSPKERVPAIKHAIDSGLRERAIYNSIDHNVNTREIKSLQDNKVLSAVLLAYNPQNVWPEGRIELLKGLKGQKNLLKIARNAGIKNILVDTAVLDLPSVGLAANAVYDIKNETGLPSGCAPSNAIYVWKKSKKSEFDLKSLEPCLATASSYVISMGSDFVLYGSIKEAEKIFVACAMIDSLIAYNARRYGIKQKVSTHPIKKIIR
jgi:tetrahydromethanopterin S-methyltransferase subunit H